MEVRKVAHMNCGGHTDVKHLVKHIITTNMRYDLMESSRILHEKKTSTKAKLANQVFQHQLSSPSPETSASTLAAVSAVVACTEGAA